MDWATGVGGSVRLALLADDDTKAHLHSSSVPGNALAADGFKSDFAVQSQLMKAGWW